MQSTETTPEAYLLSLPDERKQAMDTLRNFIKQNLPTGFAETMQYGMISYVVPHSIYPKGYHCKPKDALPFISIGSQKNCIVIHHLGIYGDEALLNWFQKAYTKASTAKLDMGKGCVRFKKMDQIPFALIGELAAKISVNDWIEKYEAAFVNKQK
ncbi:MAG: DUF1801 domain-containing protein [Pedobacter sp.]|nr:DUF1801 domain-containing protein [Chitinophagaceae bacterium]